MASGSGCEYLLIMRMLRSSRQLSLPTIELLLRPFVQFLRYEKCSTWRKGIHMEVRLVAEFRDLFGTVCTKLYHYLDGMVPANYVVGTAYVYHQSTFLVLHQLYSITCWGISYYGGFSKLEVVRDSLGKLQEKMWEQLLQGRHFAIVCTSMGAAMEATVSSPASGNKSLFSLEWLKEKKIIVKLLYARYKLNSVPKVIDFVSILVKVGVVLEERDFLTPIRWFGKCGELPAITNEEWNAHDLIVAAMLDMLDIGGYSAEFLENVLEWLEDRKAESVINGSRIFFILKKLVVYVKQKNWGERFWNLFNKHAAGVSDSDLLFCLRNIADHCKFYHETGDLKNTLQLVDKQAKLLKACSSADMVTVSSMDVDGALNQTEIYAQKAKSWEEMEIDVIHETTSSNLANTLAIDFPFTLYETAKECLDRLVLAQHWTVRLNPDKSNKLASAMTDAMSPELRTLEVLKKEILLRTEVVQRVGELSERHLRAYDAVKQEQHEKLVKFLKACRKEREDVVWEALYQKVKLLACVRETNISRDVKLSSEDILSRMLQKAGVAFKEVEVKLDALERAPNSECGVCYTEFSLTRKRACLDPCGHASACVDCATREWVRTKKCPFCKVVIEKPIPVPCKLFF